MKMLTQGKPLDTRIRDTRIKYGLTQKQVSDLTGVPHRSIQNWEGGQRKCPDYVTGMIVNILDHANRQCKFCEDPDWLQEIVCYVPNNDTGSATTVSVNHCPNCGRKLNW